MINIPLIYYRYYNKYNFKFFRYIKPALQRALEWVLINFVNFIIIF